MASDCAPWPWKLDKDGYGRIKVNGRSWLVHRYVYSLYHAGELPAVVRHTCDNRACINHHHLIAGTHASNRADCVSRRRQARGERNGRAKLSAAAVADIRTSQAPGAQLARQYGVSPRAIRFIRQGEHWQ